jgi:hypothetical protein
MFITYLIPVLFSIGFLWGLYYFFQSFRIFREYRVLADTPGIPIRGLAMGLAEVRGTAGGNRP